MNKRIAKKIEDLRIRIWCNARHPRPWLYAAYSPDQQDEARRVDGRRLARWAAAVRAKRGWAPRQVTLTVPLSRTSVAFRAGEKLSAGDLVHVGPDDKVYLASHPDVSWLPNPYCA